MNPFQTIADPTLGGIDVPLTEMLLRLLVTLALASAIAYRPWRRALAQTAPLSVETAQAQVIIAVAGALMVIVIGDSTARAFGLVGLGAFIRFRSGIKDPRDAAVMFVMIGVGMATGLGLFAVAALATAFVGGVLVALDATAGRRPRTMTVGIDLLDPAGALAGIRAALPGSRVLETGDKGSMVLEVATDRSLDAESLLATLRDQGVGGIRRVSLSND